MNRRLCNMIGVGHVVRAVGLALLLALMLTAPSGRALAAVDVSSERTERTLRIVFDWQDEITYTVAEAGNLIVVSFSRRVTQPLDEIAQANRDVFESITLRGEERVAVFRTRSASGFDHHQVGNRVTLRFTELPARRTSDSPELVTVTMRESDEGVQRLRFVWETPVEFHFAAEGRRGTIIFRRRATLRLGEGARQLSRAGIMLTAAPTTNGLAVTLAYNHDVVLRAIEDGRVVIVEATPERIAGRGNVENPRDPSANGHRGAPETTSVRVDRGDDGPVLVFEWPAKVSAAAFRRGSYIWLVFGPTARLDFGAARDALRAQIDDMEQVVTDNGTVLRLRADSGIRPIMERRNWDWRVTLFRGSVRRQQSYRLTPEPNADNGNGRVRVNTGRGGPVLEIPDPDIGDTLIVVPVHASGWGSSEGYQFPTFNVLASAQGLVVEPRADGINVSTAGEDTVITGSHPLYLSAPSH